ncbi:MAG TPA: heavy-metal-associated domain-containing protein [Rudaea sp.]|jgi:copper chaperone CopZ|uniref:heavy-metal-associated domain-containing protein n=1 Tax=Rudaea sp. TaxID=2136325 RepID=UPI002F928AD6
MRIPTLFLGFSALILSSFASATTIELDVNGLVCAFCAQGIQKKLHAIPATADVVVSLEKKLVAVSLRDGQDISDDDLRHALTDAGYTVKDIRHVDESLDDVRQRLKTKTP